MSNVKGFRQKKAPSKQQLANTNDEIIKKVQELAMADRFFGQQIMRMSGDVTHVGREVAALTELVGANPTSGPIQKEDVAIINFIGTVDGIPFDGGMGRKTAVRVGSGNFIPGFEDALIGRSRGNDVQPIAVTFPENYNVKELAGQEAVFHTQVVEVFRDEADISQFDAVVDSLMKLKEEKDADEKAKQEAAAKEEADQPEASDEQQ